jgi:poly(3-hydroxybutyrate) depolymerase
MSGLTIINDILEQMNNKSTTCDEEDSSGNHNQTKSFMSKSDTEDEEKTEESNGREKVVPLYTPDNAVVKVFMIHGSQKSALALATFALGFQQQVIHIHLH